MCDGPVSMTECAVYVVNHLIASYCDTLTLKPSTFSCSFLQTAPPSAHHNTTKLTSSPAMPHFITCHMDNQQYYLPPMASPLPHLGEREAQCPEVSGYVRKPSGVHCLQTAVIS